MERRNVLLVVGVILLAGCDQSASPSPSSVAASRSAAATATATAAPTATAEPTETAGPFEVAWEPISGLEREANVEGVSVFGGRWFALGSVSPEPAIWTSGDGRSWARAEIDSQRAEDEVSSVTDLAEVDGRLVAIGRFGMMDTDQVAWVTWTSDDGGDTWTEHRDGPSPHALRAVASGGPGLIGAGWDYSGTTPFDAWIAVSDDGVEWEKVSTTFETSEIHALVVVDDRIIAVGATYDDELERLPTARYSDDGGESWTAPEVPRGDGEESLYDVVVTDDGLVAIGGGLDTGAVAWISADGESWERIAIVDGAEGRGLALVDAGFVAIGNVLGQEFGDFGPELGWTSVDGQAWETGQEIGDGSVQMLAVGGEGSTVVAGGECLGSCDTVLWIGEVTR